MQDKRNMSASLVASVSTAPPNACCHTLKGFSQHDPSVAAPWVFFFFHLRSPGICIPVKNCKHLLTVQCLFRLLSCCYCQVPCSQVPHSSITEDVLCMNLISIKKKNSTLKVENTTMQRVQTLYSVTMDGLAMKKK